MKNTLQKALSFTLTIAILLSLTPLGAIAASAAQIETTHMYRLYNPNSGEHFYTGSAEERDMLDEAGWNYEGVAWNAPIYEGDPVYRVYNPNSGDHHYTCSADERDMLVGVGWQYEGIAWGSAPSDGVPQYRLYNPNADCGSHHYTSSAEERENLVNVGWIYEGIGWYGVGSSSVPEETQPDHEHTYSGVVTEPTCTAKGYTTYTCTICGDSYVADEVPALGGEAHRFTSEVVDPTTEAEGYTLYTCTICGSSYKDNYTDKLPSEEPAVCEHMWFEMGVLRTCILCGETEYNF